MTREELIDSLDYIREETWVDFSLSESQRCILERLFDLLEQATGPAFFEPEVRERVADARREAQVALGNQARKLDEWAGALLQISHDYLKG
jgi:hypothetical protein